MKIGIIGMGKAGRRYAEIAEADGHNVLGYDILDINHVDLDAFVKEWANAVIVATPPKEHISDAFVARRWGKPVMIEKPLSHAIAQAKVYGALLDVLTVPVTTYRFHPAAQLARFEYVAGDDIRIIYREHIDNWQAESYERDADLEARIHFVDMLYWIGGPELAKRHRELVELDLQTPGDRDCRVLVNNKPFELYPCPEAHVAQFQHFVACVEGREQPVCSLEEAIEVLGICLNH